MGIRWGWSMLTGMLFVARLDFSSACWLPWNFYCGWLVNLLGLYRGLDRQTVTKLDDRQGISP